MNSIVVGDGGAPSAFWANTKKRAGRRSVSGSGIPSLSGAFSVSVQPQVEEALVASITLEVQRRLAAEQRALEAYRRDVESEREVVEAVAQRADEALKFLRTYAQRVEDLQPQRSEALDLQNRRHVAEIQRLQAELDRYIRLVAPPSEATPTWAHIVRAWGNELEGLTSAMRETVGDEVERLSNLVGSPSPKSMLALLRRMERVLERLETFSEDCWAWADAAVGPKHLDAKL